MKNRMFEQIVGAVFIITFLLLPLPAWSAPTLITFQGVLSDGSGVPVTDTLPITFEIFAHQTNGAAGTGVWQETHPGVLVTDGVYGVLLGSVNTGTLTPDLFASDDLWLEVTVDTTTLTPRQRVTSVAFAHNADMLDGADSSAYLKTSDTSTTILSGALSLPADGLSVGTDQLVLASGKVGVGTATPDADLEVNGIDGVLFTGTFESGTIPAEGYGDRLMWYPGKAAFRVGYTTSTHWDDSNIGDYSIAMGFDPMASGEFSTAIGSNTTASNIFATALGSNTTASGSSATAMGSGSTASGSASTTMGLNTIASGGRSTAMGSYTTAESSDEMVVGRYNTDYTPLATTFWANLDRLFVIGNGTADDALSDAMVVLKNGNVGFGTSTPTSKLEVAGFIHSTSDGFKFPDGTTQISAGSGDEHSLDAADGSPTDAVFVDNAGKVGVGTATPSADLQVDGTDGVLFTGTQNSGSLPASGAGTRVMWYPKKVAFRAGYVNGSQWDDTNIGHVSIAMGENTIASGAASTALGTSTTASGWRSSAMGAKTTAESGYEFVVGLYNTDYTPAEAEGINPADRLFVIGNGVNNSNRSDAMVVLKNGSVGLGTSTPNAALEVSGDDGVLFTGIHGSGSIPVSGGGSRMMWYPGKSAFRAGFVTGSVWDDSLVGDWSVAMGQNTRASGAVSTALGGATKATDQFATAMGTNSTASGHASTATGNYTTASGSSSTAMGNHSTASGNISTAMGYETTAESAMETVVGAYDTNYTPSSTGNIISTDRLFVIGNGTADDARSDAMVVLKSGRVGLGTSSPAAGLHLKGDGYPNAFVMLDTDAVSQDSGIQLRENGSMRWHFYNEGSNSDKLRLSPEANFSSGGITILQDGNVGIGTTSPGAKLQLGGTNSNLLMYENGGDPFIAIGDSSTTVGWVQWGSGTNQMNLYTYGHDFPIAIGSTTVGGLFVDDDSNGGNVGIGDVTPTYKLTVNGTAYATGAAGSLSDRRHKENISGLPFNALQVITQLRPVTFDWKEPQDDGMTGTQLGFIAQEVEEVLPEAVLTQDNEEQTKGLKYSTLIPVLTKAIQELEAENNALKALVCLDHPDASICQITEKPEELL